MLKKSLLLAMTATWASAAAAQTAPPETESGVTGLHDIVVTARKRAESAQSVPISLTVASAADLANRSVQNLPDIQQMTPSLKMVQSTSSSIASFLALRGQVVTTVQMSTDLAVGVYIDGVYQPRAYGLETTGTLDVNRIEVLKGPQGTLFGKNTTGGAISLHTNTPTDEREGTIRARADSRGTFSIGGMVNIPISETVSARIVAEETYRDKLGRNFTTGRDVGKIDQQMIRGALSLKPTDNVSLLIRGDYTRFEGSGMPWKGVGLITNPATNSVINRALVELGLANTPANREIALAALNQNSNKNLDTYQNFEPYEKAELYGFSVTGEFDLSETITIKSITAKRWVKNERTYDYDGTQFSIFNYPGAGIDANQFSQELQLLGSVWDDRLNYIFGGYYSKEQGSDLLVQISNGGAPSYQDADVVNKTLGGFAQATFKITPELSFTGGIRYSKDWRNLTSYNRNATTCTALAVSLASIGGAANCRYVVPEAKFDGWSYTAGLDYQPMQGVLIYAKTGRGYRTGGIPFTGGNASNPIAARETFTPFRPETVTDYEVGLKADWLDGRVRTNLAYYHSNYKDIQLSRSSQAFPGGPLIPRTENIGRATIDGVEAEVRVIPVVGFELSGTLGYTNGQYKEYWLPNPLNQNELLDQTSQPFKVIPKWTYSLSASYEHPTAFGSVRGQVDWSWTKRTTVVIGSLRGRPGGPLIPDGVVPSYGLLNARLAVKLEDPNIDIAVFGRNLTDKRVYIYPLAIESFGVIFNGPTNMPRIFGVEATANF